MRWCAAKNRLAAIGGLGKGAAFQQLLPQSFPCRPVVAALAHQHSFRRQLLRNMNRGKTRKAELGRKAGGADVFGYETNDNGEYIPVPEQAKIVQLIYQLTLKDYTLRQIGAELKRRGIRTARARYSWSIAVLGGILSNDIYLGVISRNSILTDRFVQKASTLNVLGCENARLFESILFSGRFRRWLDEPAPTACR